MTETLWIPTHTEAAAEPDLDIPAGAVPRARRRERAAGRASRPAVRGSEAPVVLVSCSQRLTDEVSRVAAAAGLELLVFTHVQAAADRNPEVLLLGLDVAAAQSGGRRLQGGPGQHPAETILVGTALDSGLWEAAANVQAARVAVLPAASGWLAEHLSRRRALGTGYVLGVIGGCGGSGASSLSCWLAHAAAEQGVETLLVDGDPYGGGLDASLGSGEVPGVRWPDLADVRGTLNPVQLVSALPRVSGFSLLSGAEAAGAGEEPEPADEPGTGADPADEGLRAVMDAARAAFSLTVVDCARLRPGPLFLSCDAVLLVIPGRLRPVLAARSLRRSLGSVPQSAVIRGPLGDGLDEVRAADAVGLPLAGYLPAVRHLEHAEARGTLLERGRTKSIRRFTGPLVRRLASGSAETPSAPARGVPR